MPCMYWLLLPEFLRCNSAVRFCFKSEFNKKNTYYLFNHVDITITYHSGENESWKGARLVGARLEPKRLAILATISTYFTKPYEIS